MATRYQQLHVPLLLCVFACLLLEAFRLCQLYSLLKSNLPQGASNGGNKQRTNG